MPSFKCLDRWLIQLQHRSARRDKSAKKGIGGKDGSGIGGIGKGGAPGSTTSGPLCNRGRRIFIRASRRFLRPRCSTRSTTARQRAIDYPGWGPFADVLKIIYEKSNLRYFQLQKDEIVANFRILFAGRPVTRDSKSKSQIIGDS